MLCREESTSSVSSCNSYCVVLPALQVDIINIYLKNNSTSNSPATIVRE